MTNENSFELALASAASLPMVKIDRELYLRKELKGAYTSDIVDIAVRKNPAQAGISLEEIDKIAVKAIKFETTKVTTISAAAGIPGGIAMAATIPADIVQYTGHMLRIVQKLVYLYGWDELIGDDGIDDETTGLLTIFMGVMFGVRTATTTIAKLSASAAVHASKTIAAKSLTKTLYYPVVKKIAAAIGVKMTKDIFAKSISKVIPVIGAVASGGLTYITFKPMANKLKKHLAGLNFCNVDFYKDDYIAPHVEDVDLDEGEGI